MLPFKSAYILLQFYPAFLNIFVIKLVCYNQLFFHVRHLHLFKAISNFGALENVCLFVGLERMPNYAQSFGYRNKKHMVIYVLIVVKHGLTFAIAPPRMRLNFESCELFRRLSPDARF